MKNDSYPPEDKSGISRRELIRGAASMGALGALGAGVSASAAPGDKESQLKKGAVIVFQGDSITDDGRKKDGVDAGANNTRGLGRGYVAMLAGSLHADYPSHELKIYNRGISGNKVPDLAARWDQDAINLKPDVLSIMVGVNDYWHTIAFGSKYKGTVADYETGYRHLIERTLTALPEVRLVICDPFTFRDWEKYKPYQAIAEKLASEFKLTYVPFQKAFAAIRATVAPNFWLWDGVHPTVPGAAQMARIWRQSTGL